MPHLPGSTSSLLLQNILDNNTCTSLTSSASTSTDGQNVTFTAQVTPAGTPLTGPTGHVTFSEMIDLWRSNILGQAAVDSNGQAMFQTTLGPGPHTIVASYTDDEAYIFAGSTSAGLVDTVLPQPIPGNSTNTTLASSARPATPGR